MKRVLLLWISLILLTGCEFSFMREANIDGLDNKPKLVVHGYMNPMDTIARIHVTFSEATQYQDTSVTFWRNYQDSLQKRVSETFVSVKENGKEYVYTYNNLTGYFEHSNDVFEFNAGDTYELFIQDYRGEIVTSSATFPYGLVNQDSIEIRIVETENPDEEFDDAIITFQDIPGQRDYYLYQRARVHFSDSKAYITSVYTNYGFSDDQPGDYHQISDEGKIEYFFEGEANYHEYTLVTFYTATEGVERVYSRIDDYVAVRDLPFSEPFNFNSNIENGFGIFAALKPQIIIHHYNSIQRLEE
jgi:hypothetical protein